jgi:hypothetical protein
MDTASDVAAPTFLVPTSSDASEIIKNGDVTNATASATVKAEKLSDVTHTKTTDNAEKSSGVTNATATANTEKLSDVTHAKATVNVTALAEESSDVTHTKTAHVNVTALADKKSKTPRAPRRPMVLNSKPDNVKTGKGRCKAEAVTLALQQLGWRECRERRLSVLATKPWTIAWVDVCEATFYKAMKRHQKCYHLPRVEELTRKRLLGTHLNRMRRAVMSLSSSSSSISSSLFSFFPRSWVLPQDFGRLKQEMKRTDVDATDHTGGSGCGGGGNNGSDVGSGAVDVTTHATTVAAVEATTAVATGGCGVDRWYIVKPPASCEGRGIYLTDNLERDVKADDICVVQSYIARPLLLSGRKFDIRLYVLVTSVTPLCVYLYDQVGSITSLLSIFPPFPRYSFVPCMTR